MKRLLIVGAGGFGREIYSYCEVAPENHHEWQIGGFLDDDREALAGFDYPVGVVSGISDYTPLPGDLLVCAIGAPGIKKKICESLLQKGACFMTLIHPTATVGHNVRLGVGVVLCPGTIFTCDIEVGDFATVNCRSGGGHDCRIGRFSTISGSCEITGGVIVEDEVMVGAHATLLPRIVVGKGAFVGAGAVVVRNVKSGETVFGNPARTLMVKDD
jgi:sugar O-acyltransferase (sialic acid O-acetyltransferase NeuD family)